MKSWFKSLIMKVEFLPTIVHCQGFFVVKKKTRFKMSTSLFAKAKCLYCMYSCVNTKLNGVKVFTCIITIQLLLILTPVFIVQQGTNGLFNFGSSEYRVAVSHLSFPKWHQLQNYVYAYSFLLFSQHLLPQVFIIDWRQIEASHNYNL